MLTIAQVRATAPAYSKLSDAEIVAHAKVIGETLADSPIVKSKSEQRSFLSEAGHQLVGGVVADIPKAYSQTAQVLIPESDRSANRLHPASGASLGDIATSYFKGTEERAKAREKDYIPDLEGRTLAAQAGITGARAIPLSGSTLLTAPILGPAASFGAAGLVFGASSGKEEYDRLIKLGKTPEEAKQAAILVAATQGGGEALSQKLSLGMLGATKKAATASAGVFLGRTTTDEGIIKPFAKTYAKTLVGENLTENAQDVGTELIERQYGAGQQSIPDIVKQTTLATTGMVSWLAPFGIPAHMRNNQQASAVNTALDNPAMPAEARTKIIENLHAQAKQAGVPDADTWLIGAKADIANNRAIRREATVDVPDILGAETVDEAIATASAVHDTNTQTAPAVTAPAVPMPEPTAPEPTAPETTAPDLTEPAITAQATLDTPQPDNTEQTTPAVPTPEPTAPELSATPAVLTPPLTRPVLTPPGLTAPATRTPVTTSPGLTPPELIGPAIAPTPPLTRPTVHAHDFAPDEVTEIRVKQLQNPELDLTSWARGRFGTERANAVNNLAAAPSASIDDIPTEFLKTNKINGRSMQVLHDQGMKKINAYEGFLNCMRN